MTPRADPSEGVRWGDGYRVLGEGGYRGHPDLEVTSRPVVHEAIRVNEVGLGKQEGHEEEKAKDP